VTRARPAPPRAAPPPAGPPALPELDPVIHSQPRLRVMVVLSTIGDEDRLAFPRLQELVGMTPGNLSTHLRKLEDAGYVAVTKTHRRRVPVTYLSLTRSGRRALEDYTSALQALLAAPALRQADRHPEEEPA
jgi:DNA-binding MarR family transcriptional regulator